MTADRLPRSAPLRLVLRLGGYRLAVVGPDGHVAFLRRYLANAGVVIHDGKFATIVGEVLPHSRVYALSQRGTPVGGFALGPSTRSRWPTYLSPEDLAAFPIAWRACWDLNFVSLAHAHRRGLSAFALWMCVSDAAGALPVERILYLTDERNDGLRRLYAKVSAGTVGSFAMTGFANRQVMYWSTPERFRAIPRLYRHELLRRALTPGS